MRLLQLIYHKLGKKQRQNLDYLSIKSKIFHRNLKISVIWSFDTDNSEVIYTELVSLIDVRRLKLQNVKESVRTHVT